MSQLDVLPNLSFLSLCHMLKQALYLVQLTWRLCKMQYNEKIDLYPLV